MKVGQRLLTIALSVMALHLLLERSRRQASARLLPLALNERTSLVPRSPDPAINETSAEAATAPTPDDLQRIEGIGPTISALLAVAGIDSFAALAAQEPAAIKSILTAAGVHLGDPTTWPEQAALAAASRWEELADLQDNLQGGRRG